jgi:dihydrofolate reductase
VDVTNKFGIVAAMSRNRVIGLNGKIPWRLPEDRQLFKGLTKDKILVVGRRTYEEEPNKSHISHARHCIVVSKTLDPESHDSDKIQVSRSFPEALNLAKRLVIDMDNSLHSSNEISCWVGGGEAIYLEALLHPAADELHLTVVDIDVGGTSSSPSTSEDQRIAFFPPKYRWDHLYDEYFRRDATHDDDGSSDAPSFTYVVYKRRRQQRSEASLS